MKINNQKVTQIIGYLTLELKYMICIIEWKYILSHNEIFLRCDNIKYKIKDKKIRLIHQHDYFKNKPREYLLNTIINGTISEYIKQKGMPNIHWWSQ